MAAVDVDGARPSAFDSVDKELREEVALIIGGMWEGLCTLGRLRASAGGLPQVLRDGEDEGESCRQGCGAQSEGEECEVRDCEQKHRAENRRTALEILDSVGSRAQTGKNCSSTQTTKGRLCRERFEIKGHREGSNGWSRRQAAGQADNRST